MKLIYRVQRWFAELLEPGPTPAAIETLEAAHLEAEKPTLDEEVTALWESMGGANSVIASLESRVGKLEKEAYRKHTKKKS